MFVQCLVWCSSPFKGDLEIGEATGDWTALTEPSTVDSSAFLLVAGLESFAFPLTARGSSHNQQGVKKSSVFTRQVKMKQIVFVLKFQLTNSRASNNRRSCNLYSWLFLRAEFESDCGFWSRCLNSNICQKHRFLLTNHSIICISLCFMLDCLGIACKSICIVLVDTISQ